MGNMNTDNKPMWKILSDVADTIKDPVAKAEAQANVEKMRIEEEKARNELVGRFIISKFLDVFAILLLIAVIVIVLILFIRSLFEGFVSMVVGFWLIRYVFKKRNNDFLSTFQGWF